MAIMLSFSMAAARKVWRLWDPVSSDSRISPTLKASTPSKKMERGEKRLLPLLF